MNIFEALGYIGSIAIVTSYCFRGRGLRHVSNLASVITIVYAAGLQLWPVLITNTAIIIVNLWQLYKGKEKK